MRRRTRTFAMLLGGALVLLVASAPASASFHEMKIREISAGTGVPDSSYVEIQMYTAGQNFLSGGAKFEVCVNSSCSLLPAEFEGFTNVANGANQATVLFGDSGIPAASKDFDADLNLDGSTGAGAVCYVSEPGFSDCASWGGFAANSFLSSSYGTSPGTPAPTLTAGSALRRSISRGCPTLLEASDDTDDSVADFAVTSPGPRKNSAVPTETPCTSPVAKKKKCKKHKKKKSGAYSAKKKCKKTKKH
jgi:hypothetical protein